MSDKRKRDAAGDDELIAELLSLTTKEVFKHAVDAGIYTRDGQLTAHYADKPEKK